MEGRVRAMESREGRGEKGREEKGRGRKGEGRERRAVERNRDTVLNWSDWPVRCAQTDRHTSNENSISAIHSVHLAEIISESHKWSADNCSCTIRNEESRSWGHGGCSIRSVVVITSHNLIVVCNCRSSGSTWKSRGNWRRWCWWRAWKSWRYRSDRRDRRHWTCL